MFDPNVDPYLLSTLKAAAEGYGPYRVQLTSGYRPGSHGYHGGKGKGISQAIDVALYDRETGAMLPRYQAKGGAASPYQAFANAWYKTLDPEHQKVARWGGYFGNPDDPATYGKSYGQQDFMHFDFGRTPELGMLAGDWNTGFKDSAMKALGLSSAGGIGDAVQAVAKATGTPVDAVKAAFLSSIAGTEAPGYDTLYGGGKFTDYSQHPNRQIPIMSGPNAGDYSTAAGRYQMLKSTWDAEQKKLGLKDFSAASQDAAAWDLAESEFKRITGGSLQEALSSGDPARINAAAQVLNKQWTSLPGGAEQAKAYGGGGKTFADVFKANLGTSGSAGALGAAAVSGAGAGGGGSAATTAEKDAAKPGWGSKIAKALSGMEMTPFTGGAAQPLSVPATPAAANVVAKSTPMLDPASVAAQRQALAMAMARLNQGSLWG